LNTIKPQPDLFEIKQVLAIPRKDIEQRHELMLSIIKDRIDNADKYESERFSYGYDRDKIAFDSSAPLGYRNKYQRARRRIMSHSTRCKHKAIPSIENKLYPDYNHGKYGRMWIELKDESQ
jgi:hypothetical protein